MKSIDALQNVNNMNNTAAKRSMKLMEALV